MAIASRATTARSSIKRQFAADLDRERLDLG
jgi:hypothetical protein